MEESVNKICEPNNIRVVHSIDVNDIPPRNAPQKMLIEWCVKNIIYIKSLPQQPIVAVKQDNPVKQGKHSLGLIVFALIVVAIIGYLIFVMYMQAKGYNIKLPSFMR